MSRAQRIPRERAPVAEKGTALVVYSPASESDLKSSQTSLAATLRCTFDVARWELRSFWLRPMTYGLLLALSIIASWSFSSLVTLLARGSAVQTRDSTAPVLRGEDDPVFQFLSHNVFLVGTATLLIPLLTMPLIAEERRRGSWETVLTAAPNVGGVVAGKFLAAWCQWLACLTPWFFLAIVLRLWSGESQTLWGVVPWFAGAGLDFDFGPVCGGALGLAVVGLTFVSLGLCCSGLCRQTVSAAALSFSAMLGVLFLSVLSRLLSYWNCPAEWTRWASCFSCWGHLSQFSQGAISPQIIVGHLTTSLLLVWLTTAVAQTRDGA